MWSDNLIWIIPGAALAIFSAAIGLANKEPTEAELRETLASDPAISASIQAARTCFGLKDSEGYYCAEQAAARRCGSASFFYEGPRLYVSKANNVTDVTMFYLFRCGA